MDKRTESLITYAAIGLGGLYLFNSFKKKSPAPMTNNLLPAGSSASTNLNTSTGNQSVALAQLPLNVGDNYEKIIYPAMVRANPNIANPNYTLTPAEANQYLNNYLDIKQGTINWFNGDHTKAAQEHWHTNGVPEKRTFLPLNPPSVIPYSGPPVGDAGGGGNFLSGALKVITSIADIIVGDQNQVQPTQGDIDVIVNSAAVLKALLPYFYNTPDGKKALAIEDKMTELLNKYVV